MHSQQEEGKGRELLPELGAASSYPLSAHNMPTVFDVTDLPRVSEAGELEIEKKKKTKKKPESIERALASVEEALLNVKHAFGHSQSFDEDDDDVVSVTVSIPNSPKLSQRVVETEEISFSLKLNRAGNLDKMAYKAEEDSGEPRFSEEEDGEGEKEVERMKSVAAREQMACRRAEEDKVWWSIFMVGAGFALFLAVMVYRWIPADRQRGQSS